jgi:hypothetical protein
MLHPRGEGRGRGVPRLSENIQVTEVFVIKYECMGALKEYHWDAKGSTYGNLLIQFGEGDYIGGDTFMDHGRACFSLLKHEAAVWKSAYDGHGFLLRGSGREQWQTAEAESSQQLWCTCRSVLWYGRTAWEECMGGLMRLASVVVRLAGLSSLGASSRDLPIDPLYQNTS